MEGPAPATSSEVVSLVLALYEPSPPEVISQVQDALHRVQKSSSGWLIARDLLSHGDDKVKFFGALTIIIKLNTESDSLDSNDAVELLSNLLAWLRNSLSDGSGIMVTRKLTSAVVAFFLHFPQHWQRCIRGLGQALATNGHTPTAMSESVSLADILPKLDSTRLRALLWFSASLVEEAGKTDMNSSNHAGISEHTVANASDATELMSHCLSARNRASGDPVLTQEDCLKCLQSWVWFSQRGATRGDDTVRSLRSLIAPAMQAIYVDDLFEVVGELFSDILSSYSGFLLDSHFEALFDLLETPWAQGRYQRLIEGDFEFDSVLFGQLMLSLGDARIEQLIETVHERDHLFLARLRGLVSAQGFPVEEDKIFVPALEFWSTYVETLIDSMYTVETGTQSWASSATTHVLECVAKVWRKAAFPVLDEFMSWDSADRVAFGDARKDIADFLQSAYTVIGPRLVSTFAELVLERLDSRQWTELEAAAFCLGSLADCVTADVCDDALKAVFSSRLFTTLQQLQTEMPARVRQTCISLIERFAEYFERDAASLPDALRLLFSALTDTSLATPAARSIQRLCSSSRVLLAPEAGSFIDQYRTMLSQQQVDCLAGERVCGAIASVIQAVQSDTERLYYVEQLLSFIQKDVDESQRSSAAPGTLLPHRCLHMTDASSMAEHLALKALRCLISAGKGLQTPLEGPAELESEHVPVYANELHRLAALQGSILAMIRTAQSMFPRSSEVTENICTIFRTGFSETDPGPFVFPPDVVSQYLIQQTTDEPRIGLFVSAACSFVSSIGRVSSPEADSIRSRLLVWVIELCSGLPDPDHDTELAQNGVEFVTRLISRKPGILLQGDAAPFAERFFVFALKVLDGREPLPKAAAADFWATFMSLRSTDESLQSTIGLASSHLGPTLTQTLVRSVGGNASRSELDKLSEPLKKLVSNHASARAWIEQSLYDPSFPGHHLSHEDRALFLKKIISLRGSRATNQVVRDFWLAARGSKFAYAS